MAEGDSPAKSESPFAGAAVPPRLLLLPGDGIGPEIMRECRHVLDWLADEQGFQCTISECLIGGASYDDCGRPLTDEVLADAFAADAILLGAVGGPQYDTVARDKRPEAALLALRKDLDLFANLRPAIVFDALADASSLKPHLVKGLDLLVVRELTSGVYFGEPRGFETLEDGSERCVDTQAYSKTEIERIGRMAFELAGKRRGLVHSVEKANVMETGAFWRKTITDVHETYRDIRLEHMYADNCAMQLVRQPKQFDVIVTDNLFGDVLSDCAAMLTGSLGMLPSASLGEKREHGRRRALYEPVHGSAPDIAGSGAANPIAMISSLAMMLRYSFDRHDLAARIDNAIADTLDAGLRTADLIDSDSAVKPVSTKKMGQAILDALRHSDG